MLRTGGEERTIEFMESQTIISTSSPLLEESYTFGVVEHPCPLNCILRDWRLGPEFYNAVKIGIVQYVCVYHSVESYIVRSFFLSSSFVFGFCGYQVVNFTFTFQMICAHIYFSDDTEDDLCFVGDDSPNFWGLWRREIWLEIWVNSP